MTILSSATCLNVTDLDSSLKFYKDVLRCEDYFRFGDYAGILLGSVEIHLSGPSVPLRRNSGQGVIYIFCEGVDELYESISSNGAKVIVAISNQEYSMRDFVIEDPDGNLITFGQEISKDGTLIVRDDDKGK